MNKQEQLNQIRSRKLGALIYDARTAKRRTPEECAAAMHVPVDQFLRYERGQEAPSLPLLEGLAFMLDVPVEHFWGSTSLQNRQERSGTASLSRLVQIRDRFIGARLRQVRMEKNLSLEELASAAGLPEETIKKYELGQLSAPIPHLETLARLLDIRVEDLFDEHGPIGDWRKEYRSINELMSLSPEIREFVSRPVNRPYIELAIRLSEMNVDKLRAIAEGLLEITY